MTALSPVCLSVVAASNSRSNQSLSLLSGKPVRLTTGRPDQFPTEVEFTPGKDARALHT